MIIRMAPVEYSHYNSDTTVNEITLDSCYFRKGRGMLDAFYTPGFGEMISPLYLIITKAE